MTNPANLQIVIAIPVALLLMLGSGLTLLGAIGLIRLPAFYDRLHAPALGSSGGTFCIVLASMLMFGVAGGRVVVHEILIAGFMVVTTPITMMMLGRAALHRDRLEQSPVVPLADQDRAE